AGAGRAAGHEAPVVGAVEPPTAAVDPIIIGCPSRERYGCRHRGSDKRNGAPASPPAHARVIRRMIDSNRFRHHSRLPMYLRTPSSFDSAPLIAVGTSPGPFPPSPSSPPPHTNQQTNHSHRPHPRLRHGS